MEPVAQKMLAEASELIDGQRAKDYGSASANVGRIARLWSTVLGVEVTPDQVVLCMIQVKVARLSNCTEHRDSWVDIAGYVGVLDKMRRGE